MKIIKISLESKLSIRDFYDFHGVLNSYYTDKKNYGREEKTNHEAL